MLSLYFAQGFPAGLLAHVLPGVLREHGVGLEYLGLLKLLALPWLLKFLWAPWLDRALPGRLGQQAGRSRSWIIPLHGLAMLALLGLSFLSPATNQGNQWLFFLALVLLLNLSSASQDVATDGLAVRMLPPKVRGHGNALQIGGYKAGMIVSSSALLIAIGHWGWQSSLLMMLPFMLLLWLPIWYFPENRALAQNNSPPKPLSGKPKGSSWGYFREHYRAFVSRPGLPIWILILLIYKVPDGLASSMVKPMLVDYDYSLSAVGTLTFWTSLVGLAGVFLAGWTVDRRGVVACLSAFAVLQALALVGLAWLAWSNAAAPISWAILAFEQVADSFSNVALFAAMMHMCRAGHEGADFTLQACIHIFTVGIAAAISGLIAAQLGYTSLFTLASLCAILVSLALAFYGRHLWPDSDPSDVKT